MAKPKPKSPPTWTDVKAKLADFDRAALLGLIQNLYAAHKENQTFLHARFGLAEDVLEPYKKTIDRRQFFPQGENPIGRKIRRGTEKGWVTDTIVGVVADVRSLSPRIAPKPEIFTDLEQDPQAELVFILRTSMDPLAVAVPARQDVFSLDQEQPVFDVATMDQRLATSLAPQQFDTWLVTAFGLVALALAASGIYAIVSYYVVQHRHELGVRMVLGATSRQILRLILQGAMIPASVGVAIGTASALVLTRFISQMLFGIQPSDLASFIAASAVLVVTACVGAYIPGRRATKLRSRWWRFGMNRMAAEVGIV